ncbi:MAG: type II toxin-antitoxin system RelE/ParE family toxin [Candidatus Scalindua sp.]
MKIEILISAVKDLEAGRLFYEKQGEGLGNYFFDTLFSDIDSLALFGGVHRKIFGYYRLLSSRFPYAIYYKMENKKIVTVWRILDCRKDPKKIANSLKKK